MSSRSRNPGGDFGRFLAPLVALCLTAIAGGAAGNPAPDSVAAGLLTNGSFEEGGTVPDGWHLGTGARSGGGSLESAARRDSALARQGRWSFAMAGTAATTVWRMLRSDPVPVTAGSRYLLRGEIRTREVRREGSQYMNANFFVSFQDSAGRVIRTPAGYPVQGTSPLLGTEEWTTVQKVVQAPPGAVTAMAGCFLSMSGEAWFDNIQLSPISMPNWKIRTSARFIFHYEDGDTPPSPEAIAGNETNLVRLEQYLGLSEPGPIPYYKYGSAERKGELTGQAGNAHVEGREIHSVFWSDRHEIVHVLTQTWGNPCALVGEGLAVRLSGSWNLMPVDDAARKLKSEGRLLPLAALVDTRDFRRQPDDVSYPEAGSWVGFLLEKAGVDRFHRLYASIGLDPDAAEFDRALRSACNISLKEAEDQWLEQLEGKSRSGE